MKTKTVISQPAGVHADALYAVRRALRWMRKAEARLVKAINAEKRAIQRRQT